MESACWAKICREWIILWVIDEEKEQENIVGGSGEESMEVPGGMGADSPDSTRSNQKERSRNCLCTLRAPSSTPLLVFVNVHCFWANTLSVCVIDKDGIFSSLKKCPLSYLQFWLSAMCLQVGTCVCRPQKDAGGEEAKNLTMLQNAPQSGTKKFKASVFFCLSRPSPGVFTDGGPSVASKTQSGLASGGTPFCRVCRRNLCMKSKPCLYERPSQSPHFNYWLKEENAVQLIDWVPWACVCIDWRHWTCHTRSSAQTRPPWGLIFGKVQLPRLY